MVGHWCAWEDAHVHDGGEEGETGGEVVDQAAATVVFVGAGECTVRVAVGAAVDDGEQVFPQQLQEFFGGGIRALGVAILAGWERWRDEKELRGGGQLWDVGGEGGVIEGGGAIELGGGAGIEIARQKDVGGGWEGGEQVEVGGDGGEWWGGETGMVGGVLWWEVAEAGVEVAGQAGGVAGAEPEVGGLVAGPPYAGVRGEGGADEDGDAARGCGGAAVLEVFGEGDGGVAGDGEGGGGCGQREGGWWRRGGWGGGGWREVGGGGRCVGFSDEDDICVS